MSSSCGFTVRHYGEIVSGFLERGYRFCSFSEYRPHEQGQIILRHDIDITLEDALRIAKIDASLGVSASYHFLLTAETYNVFSASGQAILQQIRDLGQHIGWHIDPSALACDETQEAVAALQKLFGLARAALGALDACSLHRPATYGELDALEQGVPGIELPPSADALRKQMIYRSDSRRQWYQGCVCQELDTFGGAPIQLLLHPIWWTAEPCTRDEIMANLLRKHQRQMDAYLANNLSFYTSSLPSPTKIS